MVIVEEENPLKELVEEELGEDVGEFVGDKRWEDVSPIKAAIRQMAPEIKQWIKEAVQEALYSKQGEE